MTVSAAKHIIASYSKLIANAGEGRYFQRIDALPCSVPRIKMALCTYLSFLIRLKPLPTDTIQSLIIAYSYLGFFVPHEQAQELNEIARRKPQKHMPNEELMFTLKQMNRQKDMLIKEIQLFIQEEVQVHEQEISPMN
jgi:hypothetical protein